MAKKLYRGRVECTDGYGNKSYFEIKDRSVRYYGADLTPFAISNIAADKAALLQFALQDAESDKEVMVALTKYATLAKTTTMLVTP